jgi:hypothetical protein
LATPERIGHYNGLGSLIFADIYSENDGHFCMTITAYGSATKLTNTDCSFFTLITNHLESQVDDY